MKGGLSHGVRAPTCVFRELFILSCSVSHLVHLTLSLYTVHISTLLFGAIVPLPLVLLAVRHC